MADPLQSWRDTLEDLGVMGLVREAPPVPAQPPVEKAFMPPPPPPRPQPAPPRPAAPAPVWTAPTDAVGCPAPERVAGAATLEDLEQAIQGCLACPLGAGRIRFVFGEGNPRASLMFIGEGPGRDEDLKGRPFVGRAGDLLDRMIAALGLQRGDTYIANCVKCRPPDNRTPTPEESRRCLGYLRRQIELVQPKVIVTLGATPLRELVGVATGITKVRGQWQRLDMLGGLPVMPTFHPAYVLRQYTKEVRAAVWEDLQAAKKWADQGGGAAPA